ncbi:SMP-30/gluconolactonase/LRE family protein [Nocardia anaemiae]|uniref:SMP-30/gluconolactonase/LRE family protein n=1 Tax=Nocardia anaemiae TaxID=263910 RepID=UPI000B1E9103|nr:superoxide dismutase [Nocardia anaemiae]
MATLVVVLLLPVGRAAADGAFSTTIDLPAGFRPEGIAIGALPVAYLGSQSDGSIYRVSLMTGQGVLLAPGPGTPSLGLRLDHRGRLFVAGGTAGDARVVDIRTGTVSASYRLGTPPDTFVNDMVLTRSGAWFTDSRIPVLYHLPVGRDGALPPPEAVVRLPLIGDIAYVPGAFNANGIVSTPDGAGLIIVQSVTGHLFRVDPATGTTRRIDLGAETVPDGDGLLLHGSTLFVVQNRRNAIAVIALDATGTIGTVERRVTDRRFDTPTTIAAFGDHVYLPNARLTAPQSPTTPYNVVAVDRPG